MSEPAVHLDQTETKASFPVLKVFAVVVVYKLLPADSPSVRTLLKAARVALSSQVHLHLRVVDNTPGGQEPGPLPPGVEYCASPCNPGLSRPYNEAWRTAEREGYGWLLTLDQDTHLPEAFLQSLAHVVRQYERMESVAAIVPRIVDRGRAVSPLQFVAGFLPMVVPAATGSRLGKRVLALNSASLLRVSALHDVNGYDEAFPLHNSDTRLFQKLDQAGKRVMMATDIVVSHELAIMDRGARMSGARYRSMLADERAFWDLHMGVLGRMERMLRLMGRVVRDLLRRQRGNFTAITAEEIKIRLFTRRKSRVARLRLEPPSWKA